MTINKEGQAPLKTHQHCPDCGSSGCVTVWETGTYCHACEHKTYTTGKRMSTESFKPLKEEHKPYRGIPLSVVKKYDVVTGVNSSGKDTYRKYSYPHMPKYRVLPKDFSANEGFKNTHLFGMDKFNAGSSKYITVVEGEDDALAAYYMLGEKYPVISLPSASGVREALLKECMPYLSSFEQIVVATDSDEPGQRAANKLANIFPGKTYKVSMTKYKDACEFLEAGADKDFMFAWHNREKYVPSGIYNTPDQFIKVMRDTKSYEYVPTGIDGLDDKIKGLIIGEMHVITGQEGQGKTELLRAFEFSMLKNRPDMPIAVLHMEESHKTTLRTLACYQLNKDVRDPDTTVPEKDIEDAIRELTKNENLYLFDFGVDEEPEDILNKVRYFAEGCGCKFIFIDPIQQLSYGKDNDVSEERTLSKIAVQLERLASELNVGIVITAHLNDDGQTRSSRMIGKSASIRLDLSRDHMNPDPDVSNVTHLSISKNRPFTKTGYGGTIRFHPESFTIKEEV